MPPFRPIQKTPEAGHRISEKYVLGREIGKGAFGIVYECQNTETGEIVAVKRVAIRNLNPEQYKGLEQEVEVLKMLHHPNIVRYIATVKTRNHLHIVLQFMENGSLAQNLKKFGVFSPTLVALFARQVLQGLAYLHDQGVIHRDIKGANILSDKLGRVKLADFGVAVFARPGSINSLSSGNLLAAATSQPDQSTNGDVVVGTPYWMAPEIVDMLPPTSACDIWSVGCTVIELLTSKPPYFDLPPLAALYRIASEDTVPLPSNLTEEVVNFLRLCFIKPAQNRPSAHDLLENEWIRSSISQSDPQVASRDFESNEEENPVPTQQAAQLIHVNSGRGKKASSVSGNSISSYGSQPVRHRHSLPGQVYDTITFDDSGASASVAAATSQASNAAAKEALFADRGSWRSSLPPATGPVLSAVGEHDHEDWDKEMGLRDSAISSSVWTGTPHKVQKEEMTRPRSMRGMEQMAQNRAVKGAPAVHKASLDNGKAVQVGQGEVEFDKAFEGDRDLSTAGRPEGSAAARKNKGMRLAKFRESADDADFGQIATDHPTDLNALAQKLAKPQEEVIIPQKSDQSPLNIDDSEAGRSVRAKRALEVQDLIVKLKSGTTKEVVYASEKLVDIFSETPALKRTLLTHYGVTPLLESLSKNGEVETRAILSVLVEVADNDRSFQELLTMAGIVPILTRLCNKDSPVETRKLGSRLVTHFLCTSPVALHMFVACGGLSTIVTLLESRGDSPPVIELALIGVDGVQRVFAETVAPPGSHRRASMARAAAEAEARGNGVGGVSKNDFCLLFAKTPLLERLAALGHRLQTDGGKKECQRLNVAPVGVLAEVCHIFSVFSLGGPAAKKHLAECTKALRFILTTVTTRWAAAAGSDEAVWEDDVDDDVDTVRVLLNCLKNLSTESTCLDNLDSAGVVQAMVPFLSVRLPPTDGNDASVLRKLRKRRQIPAVAVAVSEVHNLSMLILFYLLRLNPTRQERAAVCGIVPYCKSAVVDKTTVKTFALQILVDMAHASDFTRHCLFKEGALDFFLDTLVGPDPFWQERALQAIEQFILPSQAKTVTTNKTTVPVNAEIERSLLRPYSLRRLVELFQSAQSEYFESVVKIFLSMLDSSAKLSEAIGRSGLFVSEITARLSYPKAEVRINLLKLLHLIAKGHSDLESLLLEHNLPAIVSSVSRSAKMSKLVIVNNYAEQLLASWKSVLEEIR